ncbi:MAG: hypothetical protein AAB403_18950 [Planctomycetota bacterium]
MTPRQHLEQIVRPNLDEMELDRGDMRFAFNAAAAVDALAAHMYCWAVEHSPDRVAEEEDDNSYRHTLAAKNLDFKLTTEVARANKHVRLDRGKPTVKTASQMATRELTVCDFASWDDIWFGEGDQVSIEIPGATFEVAEAVFARACIFLEEEMNALRIP